MKLLNLGVNHHTAPIDIRESVAVAPEVLRDALLDLRAYLKGTNAASSPEVAILSTCNRMEIYCAANDLDYTDNHLEAKAIDWLLAQKNMHHHELKPYIYSAKENMAVKHAFRVGCGLDSMVLGETQILGQMKQAVQHADEVGTLGSYLKPLFNKTFSIAKAVRGNTKIGSQSVSMASAAVRLSERIFGDIGNSKVLFIGAGEMIQLCANHFASRKPKQITISNRTLDKGHELAAVFSQQGIATEVFALQDLPSQLHQFDIVVSCTASSLPIIGMGMIKTALKARNRRPMVLIDLAVPRDVEPEIKSIRDIYLYSVDDLGEVVQAGQESRLQAVTEAESIIDQGVSEFYESLERRTVVPIIQSLQESTEQFKQIELEKARRRLAKGDDPMDVMATMAQALANKLMHAPIHALKTSPANELDDFKKIIASMYGQK
jgi:glutamyl-tRNA reductase